MSPPRAASGLPGLPPLPACGRRAVLRAGLGLAGACLLGGAAPGRLLASPASEALAAGAPASRTANPAAGETAPAPDPTASSPAPLGPDGLSRHPAEHARQLPDGRWECRLCPNHCQPAEGQDGRCRARGVREGVYRSLVYGQPCVIALDPLGKCPLYHVQIRGVALSLATAGCNLACRYCQNWQFSQRGPAETTNFPLAPAEVIRRARDHEVAAIAFFYTEPVIYFEYLRDIARLARAEKMMTVMVTAGYIEPEPLAELLPLIDAWTVGWKAFTEPQYQQLTAARLAPIQQTLLALKRAGSWFEVVSLLVPTANDDPGPLREAVAWFARELGPDVPWHFTRFFPQFQLKNLPTTPTSILEQAREQARAAGIRHVYVGNVPGHAGNHTDCSHCGKRLVERLGPQVLRSEVKAGRCPGCQTPVPGLWLDDLTGLSLRGG